MILQTAKYHVVNGRRIIFAPQFCNTLHGCDSEERGREGVVEKNKEKKLQNSKHNKTIMIYEKSNHE